MIATSQPYPTQLEATQAAAFLAKAPLIMTGKCVEIVEEAPPPPYTTASLLEDATMRLQCSADQVMRLAQLLFEGIELYGAPTGLITYHRTDSTSTAPEAISEARQVIARLYGKDTLPVYPTWHRHTSAGNDQRSAIRKQRFGYRWIVLFAGLFKRITVHHHSAIANHQSQQSHEAIRPTSPNRLPDSLAKTLDEQTLALYRLIWERFIASQMKAARYRVTTLVLEGE